MKEKQFSNEAIYNFIYFFRKTLPSTKTFYYFFIILKFFSVYLMTHNINGLDEDFLSFSRFLLNFALIPKQLPVINIEYSIICIIINVLLVIILIIIIICYMIFRRAQQKSDMALYQIPSSRISMSPTTKIFLKYFIYFLFIIMFLSQYIIEFLNYAFYIAYFPSKSPGLIDEDALISLNSWKNSLSIHVYILCVINSIGIIIMMGFVYVFLFLSAQRTITFSYGIRIVASNKKILMMVLIFHLQGLYSLTNLYRPDYRNDMRLYICVVMCVLLFLYLLLQFSLTNHSVNTMSLFISFLMNWCLISSIIEIIAHYTNINAIQHSYSLMKFVFEFFNSFFLTTAIIYKNKIKSLGNFCRSLFKDNKTSSLQTSIVEYLLLVQQCKNNVKSSFVWIYDNIVNHHLYCTNETCSCHHNIILNRIDSQLDEESLLKNIILLAEEQIVLAITKPSSCQSKIIDEYCLLHVDFLISLKKQYFLALYLCQYYLYQKSKTINFIFGYYIFEINKLIFAKFKGKRLDHFECNNLIAKNKGKIDEVLLKSKRFLKEQFKIEKIRSMIYLCICDMDRVMHYRHLLNNKRKILFQGDELLQPLCIFLQRRKKLLKQVNDYLDNQYFSNVEILYIITYGMQYLYDSKIKEVINKPLPRVLNYGISNNYSDSKNNNFMIVFLDHDDKFIIKYASINLIEKLHFTKKEFIGLDFNELLPKDLSMSHFAEMKKFFAQENTKLHKKTFLLTKELNISRINVNIRTLPTETHLVSMIMRVSALKIKDNDDSNNNDDEENMISYNLLLDEHFNFISTSKSFEKQFFFSIKMFEILKIDFCHLFGINADSLSNKFKKEIKRLREQFEKDLTQNIRSSLLPSVKPELISYYDYVIDYNLQKKKKPIVVREIVSKIKTLNGIQNIESNIEGLEKEWKGRIMDLYQRLQINKETQLSMDFRDNKTSFFLRIELKSIGSIFYYVVLIKESMSIIEEGEGTFNSDCYTPQYTKNNDNNSYKGSFVFKKEQTGGSGKSLFAIHSNPNILKTPNSNVTMNMGSFAANSNTNVNISTPANLMNSMTSLPNSSIVSNQSKVSLFSHHDIKMAGLLKKKNQENDGNKGDHILDDIDNISHPCCPLNQSFKVMRYLTYILFFIVNVMIIVNFLMNNSTTAFSMNLFNVNTYSYLVKADIFFSSLGVMATCLIKDKVREGSIDLYAGRIRQRAIDLLSHYNSLLTNINNMINHPQTTTIYDHFYQNSIYSILGKDWNTYERKASFGEEVYYIHLTLTKFNLQWEDSKCRVQEFFYNGRYKSLDAISRRNAPTEEERYLFYIFVNVINKLARKMDLITMETNNILKTYNEESNLRIDLFNWLIFLFVLLLYAIICMSICVFLAKFNQDMINLFKPHKKDDVYRFKLSLFKQLLENFGKVECKSFEMMIKTKLLLSGESLFNSQSVVKHMTSSHEEQSSMQITINNENQTNTNNTNNTNSAILIKRLKQKQATAKKIEVQEMENNKSLGKQFNAAIQPKRIKSLLVCNVFFFLIFAVIQISNIIVSRNAFIDIIIQNGMAVNYYSRIPKLAELNIYSITSVIYNELNYITTAHEEYEKSILSNFYNIQLDLTSDSLFASLGNSHFAYIYYILFITRRNIQLFTFDEGNSRILKKTKEQEVLFNSKNNYCIYMPFRFVLYEETDIASIDSVSIFWLTTEYTTECRLSGNGVNLDGSKAAADLLIRQLSDLYIDYFHLEDSKRNPNMFFTNENYLLIDDQLQLPLKKLHNVNAYGIRDEIQLYYENNHLKEISFSIVSMLLSSALITIILVFLELKIQPYCHSVIETRVILDKVLLNLDN